MINKDTVTIPIATIIAVELSFPAFVAIDSIHFESHERVHNGCGYEQANSLVVGNSNMLLITASAMSFSLLFCC